LGLERGDLLFPLADQPPSWVVLVVPSFRVSTREAFDWMRQSRRQKKSSRPSRGVAPQNDLERVVFARHPELRRLVRPLDLSGAAAAGMSGSGSAVFGLFSRRASAIDAAAELFARGRRTIVTRTVDRRSYQRLAAR